MGPHRSQSRDGNLGKASSHGQTLKIKGSEGATAPSPTHPPRVLPLPRRRKPGAPATPTSRPPSSLAPSVVETHGRWVKWFKPLIRPVPPHSPALQTRHTQLLPDHSIRSPGSPDTGGHGRRQPASPPNMTSCPSPPVSTLLRKHPVGPNLLPQPSFHERPPHPRPSSLHGVQSDPFASLV